MNKKQLMELVETMVARTAGRHRISEDEARVLVGLQLRQNQEKILAGIALPTFEDAPAPEKAAA